ncbi:MAG: DUF3800 domain-containing protein [Hyphomicrobium sp.]|uniref:DUF3800 domain-containing protein n=1 Tax=Hyphomicrobium sp. TaxID=82 RepID=UPI00132850C0|nr:DUF3800 domain-containing protein [Hyphomicrobium sp.]KAB2944105.1 MAG: DUF3800 domain-containing protein [Hyphomicrobium sp.]MBZ0209400.1 DUF3800 domain-containing protein [Hyphomicrobium sp.]
MKCRLYIDEVGNGDLNAAVHDDNARYLSLTGVITTLDYHAQRFQPQLDAMKAELFGHTDAAPVILHRRDIMRRQGPFAVLHNEEARRQFDERLIQLLTDLPYVVITVVIDKRQHKQQYTVWQYDPYHYCMMCLVERYVQWLEDKGRALVGDVVAEARNKTPDKKLKASFKRIHVHGTGRISAQRIQARLTSNDIKLHPKSDNIAGLQIADAIAYPSYRAMKNDREKILRPQDFGTRIASMLEARKLRRSPDRRYINGFGRKWLP